MKFGISVNWTQRQTAANPAKERTMSRNKQTLQRYMEAFTRSDHAEILSCLTDDVEWVVPGIFHLTGKAAFDKEIENDAFVGSPAIEVTRMTEEGGIVVAEGTVRSARRDGGLLNAVFCDVFEMQDAKIRHITSYLMEIKA
jgi:ketosteroid isomerase-like protein